MVLVKIPLFLVLVVAILMCVALMGQTASTMTYTTINLSAAETAAAEESYLAYVGQTYSHATEKHGTDAEIIRQACTTGNYRTWSVGKNRIVQTCFVEQKVGFRVLEKIGSQWEEITAYFRDPLEGQGWKGLLNHAARNGWKAINNIK